MQGTKEKYFVGLDWASRKHDLRVLDGEGAIRRSFSCPHTARGLAELLRRLRRARLREPPRSQTGPLESETRGHLARNLVAVLAPPVAEIKTLDGLIGTQLAQHPDGNLLRSFPRTGTTNAAQILAEPGDDRRRFRGPQQLAAEAGVAPVTHESGKHRGVSFRYACNKRVRRAIPCRADNSRHAHPWAADVYRRARDRGCDQPHAIRVLARARVRVLWRCWQDRIPYDAIRHGTAARFFQDPDPAVAAA